MLTYNVQAASNNLASLTDVIRNANADVVALQELSQAAAQYLQSTLADLYPNQALFPQVNAHWGQGTLSRFPIAETQYWRNEQIEAALGHMWATLEMDNRAVTVFNTHPVPPFSFEDGITLNSHSQEIRVLLQRAAQHDTPLLLVGDFNMTQLMDEYQQVTMRYVDTFREAGSPGLGFTFPAGHRLPLPPIVRLDYIFHSGHFRGLNAYPLSRSGASDHLPFWAELVLLEAPG
jgi:endonuclease/exonuclease/phosphatase (EEP) superfamily protein YafD